MGGEQVQILLPDIGLIRRMHRIDKQKKARFTFKL